MARPRIEYLITARDATASAFRSVRANADRALQSIGKIGVGLGAAAFAGVQQLVRQSAQAADEINKLSTQLGISTEALSEYQFVAQQTGVEFRQFALAIQRSVRRVAEAAQGTGEARQALRELGVDAKALTRLSPDQQFARLADALAGVESSADQVRLAFKLFDSEGVRLLRTIKAGSGEIERLREEARRLGLTLDQETANRASALVDAFGRLKASTEGLGRALLNVSSDKLVEELDQATNAVADFTAAVTLADRIGVSAFFDLLAGSATAAVFGTRQVTAEARRLFEIQERIQQLRERAARLQGPSPADRAQSAQIVAEIQRLEAEAEQLREAWRRGAIEPLQEIEVRAQRLPPLVRDVGAQLQAITVDAQRLDPFRGVDPELARRYAAILRETATPAEELAVKLRVINELLQAGVINSDQASERVRRLGEAYAEAAARAAKQREELSRSGQIIKETQQAVEGFGQSLSQSFIEGTADAGDIFKRFVNQIIAEAFRLLVIKPILDSIFGAIGLPSSVPGRAIGGPVAAGQPVVVGEQGPELFVPNTAGQVQPNAGAVNVNFTINTLDGRQAAAVISDNRAVIVGIVRDSFMRAGNAPPVV